MAIENPLLGTQQISDMRRPDVGDPGAPARALGKAAKTAFETGAEAYGAYKTGELLRDLEAEREAYVNQTNEDIFESETPDLDEKDISEFAAKYLKLDKAYHGGSITNSELKIRQERILREAMTARPWLADRFVQATTRSQGYNPIGAEVAAMAASEEESAANRSKLFNQIVTQYIGLGVDAQILWKDPQRFFEMGAAAAMDAFNLQQKEQTLKMLETESGLAEPAAVEAFRQGFLNKDVPLGFMSALPSQVTRLRQAFESVSLDSVSANPYAIQDLENQKIALQTAWSVSSDNYWKAYERIKETAPGIQEKDFKVMWERYVGGFFQMMGDTRSAAEMRTATDWYLDAQWRQIITDNPTLGINIQIAKVVGDLKTTTATENLSSQVANYVSRQMSTVWQNNGLDPLPDGPSPRSIDNYAEILDLQGKGKEADKLRQDLVRSINTQTTDAADDTLSGNRRVSAAGLVFNNLFTATDTIAALRTKGLSLPSRQLLNETMGVFRNPAYGKTIEFVLANNVVGADRTYSKLKNAVYDLTSEVGLDIRTRVISQKSVLANGFPYVRFVEKDGNVVAERDLTIPVEGTDRRWADELVTTLNGRYRSDLNNARDGFIGALQPWSPSRTKSAITTEYLVKLNRTMIGG